MNSVEESVEFKITGFDPNGKPSIFWTMLAETVNLKPFSKSKVPVSVSM
jgi:hypothetical protein